MLVVGFNLRLSFYSTSREKVGKAPFFYLTFIEHYINLFFILLPAPFFVPGNQFITLGLSGSNPFFLTTKLLFKNWQKFAFDADYRKIGALSLTTASRI